MRFGCVAWSPVLSAVGPHQKPLEAQAAHDLQRLPPEKYQLSKCEKVQLHHPSAPALHARCAHWRALQLDPSPAVVAVDAVRARAAGLSWPAVAPCDTSAGSRQRSRSLCATP